MDTTKIELGLVDKIRNQLKEKDVVRVPFSTFVRLWQPKDDHELTKELIRFKIENELDYVVIIDSTRGPQFIRFWDNSKKLLGKGDSDAICNTGEEEEVGQGSEFDGRAANQSRR